MASYEVIKEKLEERTGKVFSLREVEKNNGLILTGITEEGSAGSIKPTVYLNRFEDYDDVDEIVDEIISILESAEEPEINVDDLLKWPATIVPKMVNKAANEELLKSLVYDDVPNTDLVVYYNILVHGMDDGIATIKVTHDIIERLGCTKEDLQEAANAYVAENTEVKGMSEILMEMMGGMSFPGMPMPEKEMMYVVSNKSKVNGAVNVLNAYDKLSESLGTEDIVILPSSVHECIAIANTGDYNQLRSMVGDVNVTQVAKEDQLSDNIYRLTKDGLELIKA